MSVHYINSHQEDDEMKIVRCWCGRRVYDIAMALTYWSKARRWKRSKSYEDKARCVMGDHSYSSSRMEMS